MQRSFLRAPRSIISANARGLVACMAALLLAACGSGPGDAEAPEPAPPSAAPASAPAAEVVDDRPIVLFVGTSLTAGYGLDPDQAFPAVIQRKIDQAGLDYRVVNAGVSGETSAGALRRMDWLLRQEVAVLVVETGANDGLRGQDPAATRTNIQAIIARAREQEPPPRLVLVAMEALPNYGEDYRQRFRSIFPDLAEKNGAALVPFLLDGVAGDSGLNQPDGIHPTAEGHEKVAENVWKVIGPLLGE